MAVPVVAAAARKKWGPGSRGATAGRPKAADELARRKASRASQDTGAPAPGGPAAAPEPADRGADTSGSGGGFLAGVREGAAQGRSLPARGGPVVRDGAGVALGFLLWVWIVLPYLDGGMPRVRQVLAAKFINQGPNGQPL